MANILLVQPPWPRPARLRDPAKYWPFPLIKLAALYRSQGHAVHLVADDAELSAASPSLFSSGQVPLQPDVICLTTVFSYWFDDYVVPTVEKYRALYPAALIRIGGVHASLDPDLYRRRFPYAEIHEGRVEEAERIEPAWDLLPSTVRTQIVSWSSGCQRKCPFCYSWRQGYEEYSWASVASRIRMNRLIVNDMNMLMHSQAKDILKRLARFRVKCRELSSIEIQGGMDVRIMSQDASLFAKLFRDARVVNVRLAFDGGLEQQPMVEKSLEALLAAGYGMKSIRTFMLYNHDLPFETIVKKLEFLSSIGLSVIHSRFRPMFLTRDGYVSQKKEQRPEEYYIHPGWVDRQVRAVGSLASDISRMGRSGIDDIDEVRRYYGRPTFGETVRTAMCAAA